MQNLTTGEEVSNAIHLHGCNTLVVYQIALSVLYESRGLIGLTSIKIAAMEGEDTVADVDSSYHQVRSPHGSPDIRISDIPCGAAASAKAGKTDLTMLRRMRAAAKK